jgi:hypothetical protein
MVFFFMLSCLIADVTRRLDTISPQYEKYRDRHSHWIEKNEDSDEWCWCPAPTKTW